MHICVQYAYVYIYIRFLSFGHICIYVCQFQTCRVMNFKFGIIYVCVISPSIFCRLHPISCFPNSVQHRIDRLPYIYIYIPYKWESVMVIYMIVHLKRVQCQQDPIEGRRRCKSPGRAGDGASHAERRRRSWLDFLCVDLLAVFVVPVMWLIYTWPGKWESALRNKTMTFGNPAMIMTNTGACF